MPAGSQPPRPTPARIPRTTRGRRSAQRNLDHGIARTEQLPRDHHARAIRDDHKLPVTGGQPGQFRRPQLDRSGRVRRRDQQGETHVVARQEFHPQIPQRQLRPPATHFPEAGRKRDQVLPDRLELLLPPAFGARRRCRQQHLDVSRREPGGQGQPTGAQLPLRRAQPRIVRPQRERRGQQEEDHGPPDKQMTRRGRHSRGTKRDARGMQG